MSKYAELVPLASILPFNVGLSSASEEAMIATLGRPQMPLTRDDQPDHVSQIVKELAVTHSVGKFRVTGIRPAIESLVGIFDDLQASEPELVDALGTAGMLVVRLRKPTSGIPSTKISNHAWGTAIDFNIDRGDPPGNTGQKVPLGIARLVPIFNRAGWYSGIAFHDDMHFEVAEETILDWSKRGLLAG